MSTLAKESSTFAWAHAYTHTHTHTHTRGEGWFNLTILQTEKSRSYWAYHVMLVVKNPYANAGDIKRCRLDPWVRKIP